MTYLIIALSIVFGCYIVLIAYIAKRWQPNDTTHKPVDFPLVSIIVAARNEEEHIRACIDSLLNVQYPSDRLEVIIVNDHSTDNTAQYLREYNDSRLLIVSLEDSQINGSKKQALAYAATIAKGDIWMYTDADCVVPNAWVARAVSLFNHQDNLDIILGSVGINTVDTSLKTWQYLDTIGMMAVTNAGIQAQLWYLANGANLAIRKTVWESSGYALNKVHTYASGDDVSLVQAYAEQVPGSIAFNASPSYTVHTDALESLGQVYQQRLRWATKNTSYSNLYQKVAMGIPFLLSLGSLAAIALGLVQLEYGILGLAMISLKAIVDTIYLVYVQKSFAHYVSPIAMIYHSGLHTVYIGILGLVSFLPIKYYWKGRKVK